MFSSYQNKKSEFAKKNGALLQRLKRNNIDYNEEQLVPIIKKYGETITEVTYYFDRVDILDQDTFSSIVSCGHYAKYMARLLHLLSDLYTPVPAERCSALLKYPEYAESIIPYCKDVLVYICRELPYNKKNFYFII